MNHAALAIKVHRAASEEEVIALARLGVDYIGFDVDEDASFAIDPDPFWADDRYLTDERAAELARHLGSATGFVQLPDELVSSDAPGALAKDGFGLLQIRGRTTRGAEIYTACRNAGIELIYGDLTIAPEDDKAFYGWVRPDLPCLGYFDVQVFPSYEDAWSFLRTVSPAHADEFVTFDDLDALAATSPLFVSLNVNTDNARDIVGVSSGSNIVGLSFTLSHTKYGAYHTFEFGELVEVLELIRAT